MKKEWGRLKKYYLSEPNYGFYLDISRINFPESLFAQHADSVSKALEAMHALDSGAIANPDEQRMVGHYWLRNSELAPSAEIKSEIDSNKAAVIEFVKNVHDQKIVTEKGSNFEHVLVIGIGGSALGPQLFAAALSRSDQPLDLYFFDNTDPDGYQSVLQSIPDISKTLVLVVSKSGGTKETRNGMLAAEAHWHSLDLDPSKSFVAITQVGSKLDQHAQSESWLARFPMWDWVGGRTSVWSAVGLLPAALMGVDIDSLLQGAADMDALNRRADVLKNPAALIALMLLHVGEGLGSKNMVVLPYKDRLSLFGKYLQQLVMESLGKKLNRAGKQVNQGINVFGNKGSTDQHSYVQQLRDGLDNFFVIFINVLQNFSDLTSESEQLQDLEVAPEVTAGDYLSGFYQGTRIALYESGRESISICIDEVSAYSLGQLIALFERVVGIYAELIDVNAYDQPGVEAGKIAAEKVIKIQIDLLKYIEDQDQPVNLETIIQGMQLPEEAETIFMVVRHLVANQRLKASSKDLFTATLSLN